MHRISLQLSYDRSTDSYTAHIRAMLMSTLLQRIELDFSFSFNTLAVS